MLQAYARIFISATEELQNIRLGLMITMYDDPDDAYSVKRFSEDACGRLKDILAYLAQCCAIVGLTQTRHLALKLAEAAKSGMNVDELDATIDAIQEVAKNELAEKKFLYVPNERTAYYNNKSLCGELVAAKFPKAVPDIMEAGNCYALGRPTACVFHLMRVIPYGMEVLAKKLKVKYKFPVECQDWNGIIQPIEKALKEMQQLARSPKKTADLKYYSEIAQHLTFCKDAWRNHVSHARDPYDMPQARSVMDHVGHVMRLLAERMK